MTISCFVHISLVPVRPADVLELFAKAGGNRARTPVVTNLIHIFREHVCVCVSHCLIYMMIYIYYSTSCALVTVALSMAARLFVGMRCVANRVCKRIDDDFGSKVLLPTSWDWVSFVA